MAAPRAVRFRRVRGETLSPERVDLFVDFRNIKRLEKCSTFGILRGTFGEDQAQQIQTLLLIHTQHSTFCKSKQVRGRQNNCLMLSLHNFHIFVQCLQMQEHGNMNFEFFLLIFYSYLQVISCWNREKHWCMPEMPENFRLFRRIFAGKKNLPWPYKIKLLHWLVNQLF